MKKILIIPGLIALLFLGGCESSFLDKDPQVEIGEPYIFSDADRIASTLLSLYAELKMDSYGGRAVLGGKTLIAFDNRGEDLINVNSNNVTLAATYAMRTGDADAENTLTWRFTYLAINNVNCFLDGLEGAKDVVGGNYNQYVAEAKFVRALAYYYLCGLYSKPYSVDPNAKAVPLRITPEKSDGNNDLKRSTISEIYNFILTQELTDANINALPEANSTYDAVTRATRGSAYMLRMRIKMAMGDYAGAINDGNAITGYSLVSSPDAAFKQPFYTSENIFSFPMAINNAPTTQYSMYEYYYSSTTTMVVCETTPGIVSEAEYKQAKDKRIDLLTEVDGNYRLITKFTDNTKCDWVPIFRYAETLLNLAECYANVGGTSETQARDLLKQVRRRSISDADDILKDATIDALTGDALKQAIYKERRLEFLGEGIRGLDIVRRGETFPAKNESSPGVFDIGAVPPSNGNYMWDIPATEKAVNKAIND